MAPSIQQPAQGKDREMNVVPYDEERKLYRDVNTKFIIKLNDDGTVVAIGKDEGTTIRKLTPTEIMNAQSLGLSVATDSEPAPVPSQAVAPQQFVPQIPQQQFVPQIPMISSVQVPQVQQSHQFVPQVPQITQIDN
jgi:hypothetical protein